MFMNIRKSRMDRNSSDEIRILIHYQHLILCVSSSYIYIEGVFEPKDLQNNVFNTLSLLFDEIRYVIEGIVVTSVKKPDIARTIKGLADYTLMQQLTVCGCSLTEEVVHGNIFFHCTNMALSYVICCSQQVNITV